MNVVNNLIYEDTPRYDIWLKLTLGGTLAFTFILGWILISEDIGVALLMFAVTIFDALLFRAVLPKRFQIFEDRMKIVLGLHFAISIPFSNIVDARSASGDKTFIYWGIRFATSTRSVVEIVRKRGLNMVISPSQDDIFLERLNHARNMASNPN